MGRVNGNHEHTTIVVGKPLERVVAGWPCPRWRSQFGCALLDGASGLRTDWYKSVIPVKCLTAPAMASRPACGGDPRASVSSVASGVIIADDDIRRKVM
jgi:hypothetical protein